MAFLDRMYPMKSNKKEKIANLYRIFGSDTKLSKETIERELDKNNGDFNKTVDTLLQMSIKPLNDPTNPEDQLRMKNIEAAYNMFGGDLSRSIISVVYLQNQGDITTTVDTLLDISHDDDAIEAIRNMSEQQKIKLENEMRMEQEKRLKERKEKLEQELQMEKKRLVQMKQELPNTKNEKGTKAELEKKDKEFQEEVIRLEDGIAQKELIVSKIVQQAALCTLSVRYGVKTIVISWTLGEDMKAMVGDWIGFYKVGQPSQKYKRAIKTGGTRQGHESIPVPKTPGLYHFKYFIDGSYNEVCVSDVIHIGPQITIKTELIEDSNNIKNNEVQVSYTLKGGELTYNDWFGLYNAAESNNKNYITYHRVGDDHNKPNNTFRLTAPRLPGDYNIRFFPNLCGYNFVAKSNILRIINKDKLDIQLMTEANNNERIKALKVTWDIHSVDISSYDYIGLYKLESPNNYYETFHYLDLTGGFLIFEVPREIGQYNLRYHSPSVSKYIDLAHSETITVKNTDLVNVAITGINSVKVTWDIYSQPKTNWDWVGIFEVGANNHTYIMCNYVDPKTDVLNFQSIPAGNYEARYFSSKVGKYVDFRKSPVFTIN